MKKLWLALLLSLNMISMPIFAGGELVKSFDITVNAFIRSPNSNVVYATTSNNSVVIIDMKTLTITDTIFVGSMPAGLAVSNDGQTLYVALSGAQRIAVVDLSSKTVGAIDLPVSPFDVEVGNGYLFVTPSSQDISGIMQVNLATNAVTEFSEGIFIYSAGLLEISPDKKSLYFANRGLSPGTLAKYDASVNPPTLLYQNPFSSLGSNGQDLSLTADGQHIYYAVGGGNSNGYNIFQLETVGFSTVGSFQTGPYPRHITSSPDGSVAYAVHTDGHIDVWNATTFLKITEYPTAGEASNLIVDRSGDYLLAAFANQLRVYTSETNQSSNSIFSPVHFGAATYSVNELDSSITIEVNRDNGRGEITIDYAANDGTATAGLDYTSVSGTLTFATGQISASFTVPIFKDSLAEGDETVLLSLSNPGNGAVLATPASATLTIQDVDIAMQDYFPITPGSEWNYLINGTFFYPVRIPFESSTINNVKTHPLIMLRNGTREYYSNDAQGLRLHRLYIPNVNISHVGRKNLTLTAVPPIALASEGTGIGQAVNSFGDFHASIPDLGSKSIPYSANYTILGYDTVTVPAGTYDVIKLQGSIYILGQSTLSTTYYLAKGIGIVKQERNGASSELQSTNLGLHDMAVTAIVPPSRMVWQANKPTISKTVKVSLQNRGPLMETITDVEMLKRFVKLNIESSGVCPVPKEQLLTAKLQRQMPINLKPKQILNVEFAVSFDCANDLDANTPKNPGHEDYRYTVNVDRSVLDGNADVHKQDDVCPRTVHPPYELDVYPDGKIKDFGCGAKKTDKTWGGQIITDMVRP